MNNESTMAAAGPAGSLAAKAQAERALAFIRQNVGIHVPITLRWARSGNREFPVIGGQADWSIESICGKYGKFDVSAPGCKLPVDHASFDYDISGNKIGLTARVEYELPDSNAPMASAQPCGFFDPASLLTIFSILRSVWAIFKTRVLLEVGGNVECTASLTVDPRGDVLDIDFSKDCPKVSIESLFTFRLGVRRVEIAADEVMVFFTGSRFIKSRRFSLT